MSLRTLLWLAAATMLAPSVAHADSPQEAIWSVAGKQVLRLHASIGEMTPAKRVEMLDERTNNILSDGDGTLRADDIVLQHDRGNVVIAVRGTLLVTIAPEDAVAAHTTRERLGRVWLMNLRRTLPQLAPRINTHGA